jgi:tricorn protease
VAIDGKEIDSSRNRFSYFLGANRPAEMKLTFERGAERFTIITKTQSTGALRTQLYDEWMAANQAYVDEKSDKRIAYIHMKNMTGGELNRFLEEMANEAEYRDALILDLRNNTGGNVHDKVLQTLSQKKYSYWQYRDGGRTTQPNFTSSDKPIVLLQNEQSLSDAEMTANGFKALGLGQIIGTESYRWIIFTSSFGLVDGSNHRMPAWGVYDLDGNDLEMTGVKPDIFVPESFKDRLEGRQPQLDRAIEEIMKKLK